MNASELFKGIAVLIDDEITDTDSSIYRIKEYIESRHIPVATYKELPDKDVIPSFSDASFLVIDWDYTKGTIGLQAESDEIVAMPQEFREDERKYLIDFLKEINDTIFLPTFIFTSKDIESIKTTLSEAGLWQRENEKRNRIFIKGKDEINSDIDLFSSIEEWLKHMPSVYVLKQCEKHITLARNEMFLELYGKSPDWVKIIWDMIEKDSIEYETEFGEFILRNLTNRIGGYHFEKNMMGLESEFSKEDLKSVMEGERYHVYSELKPEQAYTGDLLKMQGKYFLNVRAQCDISRLDNDGEYDPKLYCLRGKKVSGEKIVTDYIKLMPSAEIDLGNGEAISIRQLNEFCTDEEKREEINQKLRRIRDGVFLRYGSFIEKENSIVIGCIDGKDAIEFTLNIEIKQFKDIKEKRIGRLLPPYITRVQQKLSQHIVREGILPVPEHIYR